MPKTFPFNLRRYPSTDPPTIGQATLGAMPAILMCTAPWMGFGV